LGSIDSEKDLKPRPGLLSINPPPSDARCQCCGRHENELKPFGKAGDPLVGDFDGALLVKIWGPLGPSDEEAERIYEEYFNNDQTESQRKKAKQLMVLHYGEEEAEGIIHAVAAAGTIGSSWVCRDCIILDSEEYWEKHRQRWETEM
jgi:hypothetical protein